MKDGGKKDKASGSEIWGVRMDNSRPLSPRYSKVTQRGMVDGNLDLGSALLCASLENNNVQPVETAHRSSIKESNNPPNH